MTIKPITLPHHVGTSFSYPLNELLMDEYLLYTETRICHWHLDEQPTVDELRNFLQRQYEALDMLVDQITTHLRADGYRPVLRPRAFQHIRTFLADDTVPTPVTMLKNLIRTHITVLQRLQQISRSGIIPAGTIILIQELTTRHSHMHCLLRARLTLEMLQACLPTGRCAS